MVTIDQKNINLASKLLIQADAEHKAISPIRTLIGSLNIKAAYQVQQQVTQYKTGFGKKVIGKKIGLTSHKVQKQLGVDQPDFGSLFQDKLVSNDGTISMKQLLQPKVEAEVAFILKKDIKDSNLTPLQLISYIEYAQAAIEVVGSRILDWDIAIADTIADNASASHFVLGNKKITNIASLDLPNLTMTMYSNGKEVSHGTGADCLGSPLIALSWLAKKMIEFKQPLNKGDIIMTGAVGKLVDTNAGDVFTAKFENLGEVSVSFID